MRREHAFAKDDVEQSALRDALRHFSRVPPSPFRYQIITNQYVFLEWDRPFIRHLRVNAHSTFRAAPMYCAAYSIFVLQ